jgi:hypothetical protein
MQSRNTYFRPARARDPNRKREKKCRRHSEKAQEEQAEKKENRKAQQPQGQLHPPKKRNYSNIKKPNITKHHPH